MFPRNEHDAVGIREGSKGGAEPAFGERPCLQGLVSYTFRRTAGAKGGCGL